MLAFIGISALGVALRLGWSFYKNSADLNVRPTDTYGEKQAPPEKDWKKSTDWPKRGGHEG